MSVTKNKIDCYRVRNGHEWATIAIQGWRSGEGDHVREGGEILVNSTFGQWATSWGHMGSPIRKFLLRINDDYLMQRFLGVEADVFDGEATLLAWKRELARARRARELTADQFQQIWDDTSFDPAGNADVFWHRVLAAQPSDCHSSLFDEPWTLTIKRTNPQAVGFFREIWPEFREQLQSELELVPA